MRLQHIIEAVTAQPWLITPAAHASIIALVQSKLSGVVLDLTDMFPEPEQVRVENGVGVLPIKGVIGSGLSKLEKSCGAVSVEDIRDGLAALMPDPECKTILLDIDSPGGAVSGIPELAAEIAACDEIKRIYAFTDGQMDSGAYWLASAAREIIASPSAEVGSIGVYMPWMDSTAAYAAAGLRVEGIKNTGGTYKGMGIPGTALTQEQRDHLQQRVDEIFGMFTRAVNTKRTVGADSMRGQTFMAASAKAAGLIEQVCTFDTAMMNCTEAIG